MNIKRISSFAGIGLLACTASAWSQAPVKSPGRSGPGAAAHTKPAVKPPRVPIIQQTLANGLKLVLLEDHSTPVIAMQLWYHVGSKDERPGRTGFAHFFEHLLFKGSKNVLPDEHSRIIEAAGGVDNATTREDVTIYYQTIPSNYLERVLWLEADRLGSLVVDDTNFKSEREVVKEERRMRLENAPYGLVFEDLYRAAYTVHPYKQVGIGTMEDLNKAEVKDVVEFHRTFYRPDNLTVLIIGDFDPAEAIRLAQKYLGAIPRPAHPLPRVTVQEPQQTAEKRVSKWYGNNSPLPAVIQAYRMPAMCTPDSYPLNLAANILSNGESSRLFRKLVYEDQIAVQTAGFGNFTEHPNLFWVFAVMNPGKSPAEGEKAIEAQLELMKKTPASAEELEKAKNQTIANFILSRQTVEQKAFALGNLAVICGDAQLFNAELDRYLAVTAADIQRVAQKYFLPTQRTVLVIEPPAGKEGEKKGDPQ
jgi:zinc protease